MRQLRHALGYELRWKDIGELNLGLARSDYRKRATEPDRPLAKRRDKPWLWNGALALHVTDRLTVYAAMTRGLEESGTAPEKLRHQAEDFVATPMKFVL